MAKSKHPRPPKKKTRRLQGWLLKPKKSLNLADMYMFNTKKEAEEESPGEDWEIIPNAVLRFPR